MNDHADQALPVHSVDDSASPGCNTMTCGSLRKRFDSATLLRMIHAQPWTLP